MLDMICIKLIFSNNHKLTLFKNINRDDFLQQTLKQLIHMFRCKSLPMIKLGKNYQIFVISELTYLSNDLSQESNGKLTNPKQTNTINDMLQTDKHKKR